MTGMLYAICHHCSIRCVQFIQHEFSMFRIMLDIECQDGLQTNNKRLPAQISLYGFCCTTFSVILYLPSLNRWFYVGRAYRGSNKWCSSGLIQVAIPYHKAVALKCYINLSKPIF